MTMLWVEKEIDLSKSEKLMEESNLSFLASKLLVTRGIETKKHADDFLKPNFAKDLHNPSSMADIDKALKRINKAITSKQKVLVHGDYDADGVTTTSIFVKGFKMLGFEVDYFVPNRFNDGYGVNIDNVERFSKYDLVITGDTGIKAFDSVHKLTHETNTDVIVTDHHEPLVYALEERDRIPDNTTKIEHGGYVMGIPDCLAVINPKRIDCNYPGKDLSGAGVAFKLMEALFDYLHYGKKDLYQLLDLVATGLVPDLVHMFDIENESFEVRNLVKLGLSIMNNNPKPWVRTVQEVKEEKKNKKPSPYAKPKVINSTDLGFTYGPILNATGRLYDPTPAAEFLMEENEQNSLSMARKLIAINEERRKLSAENTVEILKMLKDASAEELDYGIVVATKNLHVGITGLVAGNILQEYYRTTIALAEVKDKTGKTIYKGSARSIPGIIVLDALIDVERKMGHYTYGGHEQAAGITLQENQLEPFKKYFREAVKKQADAYGDASIFEPKKFFDAEMTFEELNHELIYELNAFEPYGMGNVEPIFYCKEVIIENISPLGKEGKYLKLHLTQDGKPMEAVMFSQAKETLAAYEDALDRHFRVPCEFLGVPQINDYNNKIQVQIKELRIEPSH